MSRYKLTSVVAECKCIKNKNVNKSKTTDLNLNSQITNTTLIIYCNDCNSLRSRELLMQCNFNELSHAITKIESLGLTSRTTISRMLFSQSKC